MKSVYATVSLRYGIEIPEQIIADRFAAAWNRQEAIDAAAIPAFATSRLREMARWRGIVDDVFLNASASDAIFKDLWDHFAQPTAWQSIEEGMRKVDAAVLAGCSVALASNFDERLQAIASVVQPLTRADFVFASSEIGWRKPAPQFVRTIQEQLGLSPHELLMVGDDLQLDIAAANRAGWQALHVPC